MRRLRIDYNRIKEMKKVYFSVPTVEKEGIPYNQIYKSKEKSAISSYKIRMCVCFLSTYRNLLRFGKHFLNWSCTTKLLELSQSSSFAGWFFLLFNNLYFIWKIFLFVFSWRDQKSNRQPIELHFIHCALFQANRMCARLNENRFQYNNCN